MSVVGFVGALVLLLIVGWLVYTTTSGHRRVRFPYYNPHNFPIRAPERNDPDQRAIVTTGPGVDERLDPITGAIDYDDGAS
jgi:hypothetical protein